MWIVALLTKGIRTQGVLVEKLVETSRSRRGNSKSWHWVHSFEVDGKTYGGKHMLDMGRGYDSADEGDVIDVVYDPRDPNVSRSYQAFPIVRYSLLILFIFAMTGLLAFVPMRILLRQSAGPKDEFPMGNEAHSF